ncbi:MAG TPA: hypothetical protein VMJ10_10645 [Kofleriaceae bacterium]|nr:hypothetical protein [Kofleriaceae bacterium]
MKNIPIGLLCLALVATSASADVTLQNDNFQNGDIAGFEAGFGLNDVGASRFLAPDAGRQLLKVQVIFGPDDDSNPPATYPMTLEVYDDSAGTAVPGASVYDADYSLVASSTALQEIDLSSDNVTVPQQFRVGLVFQHGGSPGLARDSDTSHASMNYIYDEPSNTWATAQTFHVEGNWIFRAVVSGSGGGSGSGSGGADAGVGDITCTGNAGCPTGSYCDTTTHACTFDCRTSSDCGGTGTCNSLGMCVNGEAGGKGGCCRADRGGGSGAAALAVVVLGFIRRRKRA